MPRRARKIIGGCVYHLLNRSAGRATLFEAPDDYDAFVRILAQSRRRHPIRLLGWCLMPNHWHLVVWPRENEGELVSEFMRHLTVTHATRWRWHRDTLGDGPVYQGRFKAFPVEDDRHYLTVLRYAETNAWRAGLCRGHPAESWRWSSLYHWCSAGGPCDQVDEGPLSRPSHWLRTVNTPLNEKELKSLRRCAIGGRPFGEPGWANTVAAQMGLAFPPRPRGRPRKPVAEK
jgi:putative transposase